MAKKSARASRDTNGNLDAGTAVEVAGEGAERWLQKSGAAGGHAQGHFRTCIT